MEKRNTDKNRRKSAAAGVLFALSLFAVVVFVFLFSDAGNSLGAEIGLFQTVYEPTPDFSSSPEKTEEEAPSSGDKRLGCSPEEFTVKFDELCKGFTLAPIEEAARTITYAFSPETDLHAQLELSLQSGIAEGFILTCDLPVMPEPLPADAGNLLTMAYEEKLEACEAGRTWIADTFLACVFALDPNENLSTAALYEEADSIANALFTNSVYEGRADNVLISFQPYGEERCRIIVRPAE